MPGRIYGRDISHSIANQGFTLGFIFDVPFVRD